MTDKQKKQNKIRYKTRQIRMADKTWEAHKQAKIKLGKSWNLYMVELLKTNNK